MMLLLLAPLVAVSAASCSQASADVAWFAVAPERMRPDIVAMVHSDQVVPPSIDRRLVERLEADPRVVKASVESGDGSLIISLALAETSSRRSSASGLRSTIAADVAELSGLPASAPVTVLFGGRRWVEEEYARSWARSSWLVAVAAVVVALGAGTRFGWRYGLGAAVVGPFAVGSAASLSRGGLGVDQFDGTWRSTGLPGAFAGLALFAFLAIKFPAWFERGGSELGGSDPARSIRRSLKECCPEAAWSVGSLVFAALAAQVVGGGPSVASNLAIGGLVGMVVSGATLPFLLASGLHGAPSDGGRVAEAGERPIFGRVWPDGRSASPLVVVGVVGALAVVGVFGLAPGGERRLGPEELGAASEAATVHRELLARGAFPTRSLIVGLPPSTTAPEAEAWALRVGRRTEIGWVDLGDRRYADGVHRPVPGWQSLIDGSSSVGRGGQRWREVALVVPAESASVLSDQAFLELVASEKLQGLTPALSSIAGPSGLSGKAEELLLLAVMALGLAGYVLAVTGGRGLSVVAGALVVCHGVALVGVARLLTAGEAVGMSTSVAGVVSLSLFLTAAELVREATERPERRWSARNLGEAGLGAHLAVFVGAALVGVVGMLRSGGPGAGAFGVSLVLGLALAFASALVLFPSLLGCRPAFHALARPVRRWLSRLASRGGEEGGLGRTEIGRGVAELVAREESLNRDPTTIHPSEVFRPGTPIYRQAVERWELMVATDCRVAGGPAAVRADLVLEDHLYCKVWLVVDRPTQQLLNSDGEVVGRSPAERREGLVWLERLPSGLSIVESLSVLSVALPAESVGTVQGDESAAAIDLTTLGAGGRGAAHEDPAASIGS